MMVYAHYYKDARVKKYVNYLSRLGHSVDVLALKEPHNHRTRERISNNVSLYYLTDKYMGRRFIPYIFSYVKFFLTATWILTRLWMTRGYHIIHVNNMPNFIVFTTILPRLFGVKVILDMHDIMSQLFIEKFGVSQFSNACMSWEERLSARYAHHILCADDFQRDFLIKNRGLPPGEIQVVLNLPDLNIFHVSDKREPSEDPRPFNIVYHGTITYRLGIDIIIRAIARIKKQVKIKMYIYGTGDYMNECLRVIDDLNIGDVVYASKKFFNVEDLPGLLHGMQLGVIGNRASVATKHMLPVKMMEYMSLRIPVVAPDMPNIHHYFSDKCICYYEPESIDDLAQKIMMLIHSSKKRIQLADHAYALIRAHGWNNEFEKYLRVLESLRNR